MKIVDAVNDWAHTSVMAKDTIGVRLDPEARAALEAVAKEREWTLSYTAGKAIVDWLTRNGLLVKAKKGPKK